MYPQKAAAILRQKLDLSSGGKGTEAAPDFASADLEAEAEEPRSRRREARRLDPRMRECSSFRTKEDGSEQVRSPRAEEVMCLLCKEGTQRRGLCMLSCFSHGQCFCNPMDSSVHGVFQVSILEWAAISSFRGSSQPRDRTCISCIAGGFFITVPPGKPQKGACQMTTGSGISR